jgi:hypothetical protein
MGFVVTSVQGKATCCVRLTAKRQETGNRIQGIFGKEIAFTP